MTSEVEITTFDFLNRILDRCEKSVYMDIRRVAIETILHTDMVHHFPMVSEIKLLYEENTEIIKACHNEYWNTEENALAQAQSGAGGSRWELPWEAVEFWRQPERSSTLRKLILHSADVSNAFKPFPICRAWAVLVLEEFFAQGDKEKALGMTVQMLNDRNKVKRCQSQIGFLEFVVFPLYL